MYAKKRLGKELEVALNQKYIITSLSRWAEKLH